MVYMKDISNRCFTDAVPPKKTLVASFEGHAYTAEREDGILKSYLSSVESIEPNATLDRKIGSEVDAAELQRRNVDWRRRRLAGLTPC
jgi:hypothetical protein